MSSGPAQDGWWFWRMGAGEGEVRVMIRGAVRGCCLHKGESSDGEEDRDVLSGLEAELYSGNWERKDIRVTTKPRS